MKNKVETKSHKATIETMINTTAILLTGAGGTMLVSRDGFGIILIAIGFGLEYFKYWGRSKNLW